MSGKEPAPQMTPVESSQMVSTVKLPILKKGKYTLWSMRMEQYLTNTDYGLWQVILNGDGPVQVIRDENDVETKRRNDDNTEELNLTDVTDIEVIIEDKGSGDKGGSTVDKVSTWPMPEVSAASAPVTTAGVAINEKKAKEKGVAFRDVEETPRQTRSTRTLKPLPSIDPKDKGKEQVQFKKEQRITRGRAEEQAAKDVALIDQIEDVKPRMDVDAQLAAILQEEEREQFLIDEQARFLKDTIAKRKSKKRPRADPDKESAKKQKLEEDSTEKEELGASLDIVPRDKVATDVESLATKPTPQMTPVESPQMVSTVKLPILKKGKYTLWSIRMEQYLTNTDYALWQVILNGDGPVQVTRDENGVEIELPSKTAQAILARKEEKGKNSTTIKRRLFKGKVETSSNKSLEVIMKDKGSGDKGGSTVDKVSTVRSEVSAASAPVTTTGVAINEKKAKEKGVAFKDVEETPRQTRSTRTLKPLPSIDPKDKGKGILQEPKKSLKISRKAQMQIDKELAQRLFEEEQAQFEKEQRIARERAEEQAAKDAALIDQMEDVEPRMDVDAQLAAILQEEEREQFLIDEQARFLKDTIAKRKRFFAVQIAERIRTKPPTRAQLKNKMVTFLKHMGKYTHNQLKSKSFEEIQKLYEKEQKWINDFVPMDDVSEKKNDDGQQPA
nr:ribonuclease H-like domain-containing protein [Tanacetum cinerariifolium]